MIKKKAINLFFVLFILLLTVQLNFVSAENTEGDFFYPEDAMPCNLDKTTEYLEEYLVNCKELQHLEYRCDNPNSPYYGFGIQFPDGWDVDFYNDACKETRKKLDNCYIPISGSSQDADDYVGASIELDNTIIGFPYVAVDEAPSCVAIMIGADLCSTDGMKLVESCESEMSQIDYEPYIKRAERNLLYTKSELVDEGYVWFSEAPETAKINGLRKRAETASMSLGRTAFDDFDNNDLDFNLYSFRISMTYYSKAKGGAYPLARGYYGFKELTGDDTPTFMNKARNIGKIRPWGDELICLMLYNKGICSGITYTVSAFWQNTYPKNDEVVACTEESVIRFLDEVKNINENNLVRQYKKSLSSLSFECEQVQSVVTYLFIFGKSGHDKHLLDIKIGGDYNFENLNTEFFTLRLILADISRLRPVHIIYSIFVPNNHPMYLSVPGHAVIGSELVGVRQLGVYDPSDFFGFPTYLQLTLQNNKLYVYDEPSQSLIVLHPEPTNNYNLHTKNCKCDKICEDYDANAKALAQTGLDVILDPVSTPDGNFAKWLEYQYADSACT